MTRKFVINPTRPIETVRKNFRVRLLNEGDPVWLQKIFEEKARADVENFYLKCRQQVDMTIMTYQSQQYETANASMRYRRNFNDEVIDVRLTDKALAEKPSLPLPDLMYITADWTSGNHDIKTLGVVFRGINTQSVQSLYPDDNGKFFNTMLSNSNINQISTGYLKSSDDFLKYNDRYYGASAIGNSANGAYSGDYDAPPGEFSYGVMIDLKYLREVHGFHFLDMRVVLDLHSGYSSPTGCFRYYYNTSFQVNRGVYAGQVWNFLLLDHNPDCGPPVHTEGDPPPTYIADWFNIPSPLLYADGSPATGYPNDVFANFFGSTGHDLTMVSGPSFSHQEEKYEGFHTEPLVYDLRVRTYLAPDLKFLTQQEFDELNPVWSQPMNIDPSEWVQTAPPYSDTRIRDLELTSFDDNGWESSQFYYASATIRASPTLVDTGPQYVAAVPVESFSYERYLREGFNQNSDDWQADGFY